MSILEVNNVSIRYITGDFKDIGLKEYVLRRLKGNYRVNAFWADRDVSFTLEKGEMLGIIGSNGAGKSTLLKAVSGIMEPTKGSIRREGTIAALLELASGFDGDLTVRENTYLRGAMMGYTRKFMNETYDQIISFAELKAFQDRPFKQLSSGMKSRLAFSIASLVRPDILILDEVLSVGDGAFKEKSEAKMREIISSGATTILVSHSIPQIRDMCSKVLWLDKGSQVAYGYEVNEICDRYEEFLGVTKAQTEKKAYSLTFTKDSVKQISLVGEAYAGNCVNSSSFRRDTLFSYFDGANCRMQFCTYFDAQDRVVVAKRFECEEKWQVTTTGFTGNPADARDGLMMTVDGEGFVHLAWSVRSGKLQYAVSTEPCGLVFEQREMLGDREEKVVYPGFYRQPSGDLLFIYRDGCDPAGNVVVNRYMTKSREWHRATDALISGEGMLTPYWQACVDSQGRLHITWCWRRTPDLNTNFNIYYLCSTDESCSSFRDTCDAEVKLPATVESLDPVCEIPEGSLLINQTAMTTDEFGTPFLATYFKKDENLQYYILFPEDSQWRVLNTGIRKADFDASKEGNLVLALARPQILVEKGDVILLIRDEERGARVSVVRLRVLGDRMIIVSIVDITEESMGAWEPNYDSELWKREGELEMFVHREGARPKSDRMDVLAEQVFVARIKCNRR